MPSPDPALWPTVRRLFDLLDEVPEAEREAVLRRECTGPDGVLDDAVFAEVRALLEADASSEADDFLGQAAAGQAAHLLAELAPDAIGERVGPWQVTGLLGEGGMGVVYRARRADGAYEQEAALKVIGRGLAPPSLVERFRRERQILAGLNHPHVARLLDGGLSDAGQPYFALELVEGEPITTYAERCGLRTTERVRLLRQVIEAVGFAHRRLVVHRDLKPSNVLVTESDGRPRAMLLDFGIAKLLDDDGLATRTGGLMTPDYAAPEQVVGGEITTATDVYALGVLLYELVTGQRPHRTAGLSPTELERTLSTPPRPPSASSEARPSDLDAIVLKALAPEPDRRYASADALGDDLDRFVEGLPVTARAPTAGYRIRSFVRRHPAGVAAASAFVALLIGFSAVTAAQARKLSEERDRAEVEAETATQTRDYITDLFAMADPDSARGRTISARELLDAGALRVEDELSDQPDVRAALHLTFAGLYENLALYPEALRHAEMALSLRDSLYGSQAPETAEALRRVGGVHQEAGRPDDADRAYRRAVEIFEASTAPDDPRRLDAQSALAMALAIRAEHDDAIAMFSRLADGYRLAGDSILLSGTLHNLGSVYNREGRFAEAESVLREALAIRRKTEPGLSPVGNTLNSLAVAIGEGRGALDEAEALLDEALILRRRLYGEVHPEVAQTLNNLGRLQQERGDAAAAEATYRELVPLMEATLGPEHPYTATVYQNLALVLDGLPAESARFLQQAVAATRSSLGPDHPVTAEAEMHLADTYQALGRTGEARRLIARALPILQQSFPADDKRVQTARRVQASI